MKPDLDPHDVDAVIRRHEELTRQTYQRYGIRGAANDEEIFRPGVGSRIAVLFIVAVVSVAALALAISGWPGATK